MAWGAVGVDARTHPDHAYDRASLPGGALQVQPDKHLPFYGFASTAFLNTRGSRVATTKVTISCAGYTCASDFSYIYGGFPEGQDYINVGGVVGHTTRFCRHQDHQRRQP